MLRACSHTPARKARALVRGPMRAFCLSAQVADSKQVATSDSEEHRSPEAVNVARVTQCFNEYSALVSTLTHSKSFTNLGPAIFEHVPGLRTELIRPEAFL